MSVWREHRGGACPVHPDALVHLRYACGVTSRHEQRAGGFDWRRRDEPFDIVAYQVDEIPKEVRE